MTALVAVVAVLLGALLKGAIAVGFPTLATPLLTLVVDVKTAVALLLVPNLVMDGYLVARRGGVGDVARRLALLLGSGAVGMIAGTRLLVMLPPRAATLVLGCFLVTFVTLNATGFALRVPAAWERWLSPVAGLVTGVVGGVTNVPGTPLAIYFYALGLPKPDFVRTMSFAFLVMKLVQLASIAWYGLLTWPLLAQSGGLTVVGLAGFAAGLRVQDRLDQRTFNRVVLAFLAALGLWLIARSL